MPNRRDFFKYSLGILGGVTFSRVFACSPEEIKNETVKSKLFDAEGGVAKRLAFVEDAKKADHQKYEEGQQCGQCRFFNAKRKEGEFAPCSFARNRYVPSCGWCKQFNLDPNKVSS